MGQYNGINLRRGRCPHRPAVPTIDQRIRRGDPRGRARFMHLVALCRGRRPRRPAQARHRSPWRASGGSLSFCGERKGGKNAAKTDGFGFLARAWCGMYRDLSAPRIKRYKPALCFRIAFCAYPPRRAPRLCCLSKQGSPLRLPAGRSPAPTKLYR